MNARNNIALITDDGSLSKYFAMMLHIDDDELDPFEYRLLGHYRKQCGLSPTRTCTEAIETTAARCLMSIATARKARKSLIALGCIHVSDAKHTTRAVTIVDRMAANIERYAKMNRTIEFDSPEVYHKRETRATKNDSPALSNLIAIKEVEEEKNNTSISNEMEHQPDQPSQNYDMVSDHIDDSDKMATPLKPEIPQLPKVPAKGIFPPSNEVKEKFAIYCYRNPKAWQTSATVMMRALNTIAKAEGRFITVEDLRGHYTWWVNNDWRGKKGDMPKPYQVTETWAAYKASLDPDAPSMSFESVQPSQDVIPIARVGITTELPKPGGEWGVKHVR